MNELQEIKAGIDVPGGDKIPIDEKQTTHLERAAEAIAELSWEYKDQPIRFYAYGNENEVKKALAQYNYNDKNVTVIHVPEVFPMNGTIEKEGKLATTIKKMAQDLRDKKIDFIYSSGNSAATVYYSWRCCRPLGELTWMGERANIHPSLATHMPWGLGKYFYINDAGGNKEPQPIDLFISAILTQEYANSIDPAERTIGLLDCPLAQKAEKYFTDIENYAGIITPDEIFKGKADIIAVDGFRGNIFLKTAEAIAQAMRHRVKHATIIQKLFQKDKLLTKNFAPLPTINGYTFKTQEYYNTIWSQLFELLAKKPSTNYFTRLDNFFTRIPGSRNYRLITGNNLEQIMKNANASFIFNEKINNGDIIDQLIQGMYALAQSAYNKLMRGKKSKIKNKNIAVLSNGEESVKGDEFAKKLLKSIPATGFVEPEHLFEGKIIRKEEETIDVIATDRYSAEIYAKTVNAVEENLGAIFKELLTPKNLFLYAFFKTGQLKSLKELLSADEYNGSPIMGIKGYSLVGHGKSTKKAIKSAIRRGIEYRQSNFIKKATTTILEIQMKSNLARKPVNIKNTALRKSSQQ